MQGAVNALAIQNRVAFLNLVAYWIIEIPLALYLCLKLHYGLVGIWYSLIISQIFLCMSMVIILTSVDWSKQA